MIAVMAKGRKKDPNSKRSLGGSRQTKPKVTFHPPAPLLRIFDKHIETLRPETDRTKMLKMLMEEYLKSNGLWPPPEA